MRQPSEFATDSTCRTRNWWNFAKQCKLLKRLVDGAGLEPAASSLRTRRSSN
jgi:hypothetical protein